MAMGNVRDQMPNQMPDLIHELMEMINEVVDFLTEVKTDFEAHTHAGDGAQAGSYFVSNPKTDAETVDAGTDRTIATALPVKISH